MAELSVKGAVGAAVGAIVGIIAVRAAMHHWLQPDVRSQSALSKVAAAASDRLHLPTMLDEDTQLYAIDGIEGVLVYRYRLVRTPFADIQPGPFLSSMRANLVASVCATTETRDLLERAVTLRYSYSDMQGATVGDVDITLSDCGP